MAVSSEMIETRMSAFREACACRGVKVTHQRLEIYRELTSSEEHPDADAICQGVRNRVPTISRDTVYRNLKMLAEHGLISIVGMSHERLRFDANMELHYHFVCVRCGLIRDFYSQNLDNIDFPAEAVAFGDPVSLHLEVKGVCRTCRSLADSSS
ncbi:MAG: transcriptional repressor [Nitrospiraceae bacterium]|nr:transcriptional repressor [Nitrospiraceae bacterium]